MFTGINSRITCKCFSSIILKLFKYELSPLQAKFPASNNKSVTPPNADTTTATLFCNELSLTIAITLFIFLTYEYFLKYSKELKTYKKNEEFDLKQNFKFEQETTLYNQKDSGILEIIAKDSFENTVKEQFKINGTNILNVQINLSDLKGDEFNFKFKHLGWEQDIQLILVESMLIDKVF